MQKPAITQVPIQATLAARWSGRAYDAHKPVSRTDLISLLEAARWAPSCFGDEPWRFIVWDKTGDAASWQQAFDCLVPGNQAWVIDAPILLLTCANSVFDHNGKPNRFAQYDTGAAAENLCLQASHLGLMAHQMGGFNADLARASFGIPDAFTPMAMICVGYPAEASTLTAETLARETAPRKRKALADVFFEANWNQAINHNI